MTDITAANSLLASAGRVQILTHLAPDGDAIGSLLGLSWALRAIGKATVPVCVDGCPDTFRFLPGSQEIVRKADPGADLTVFVDCADQSRAGKPGETLPRQPDINFDHHITNPLFARLNFVDAGMTATSELLFNLLPGLGLPLTQPVAECLLCGLVSDTLGFRTSNTGPRALAAAQSLLAAGADLPSIYDRALNRRSTAAVRLWGQALAQVDVTDGIAWTAIPQSMKQVAGYNGRGDADVINVLSTIEEARIFIVMTENGEGHVKISWRARPGLDVARIAQVFGGGGHVSAAGATVAGTLIDVQTKVLDATRAVMGAEPD
jgi:phosphoesterase RecJ-like protein